MPRPIVEIHQKILNQVITPNDPEQSVCIVGLHAVNRSGVSIGQSKFTAEDFQVTNPNTFAEFNVDEAGVIINSDLDLGTKTIDGDLFCTLTNIKKLVGSKVSFSNFSAFGARKPREVILHDNFSGNINTSASEIFISVSPKSTLRNVVSVSLGSGQINLLTGAVSGSSANSVAVVSAIANLTLNSTSVAFSGLNGLTYKVIARSADKLYIYGTNADSEKALHDAGNELTDMVMTVGANAISGFKFSITAAEHQTIAVDSFDVATGTAILASDIRFCSIAVGNDNLKGSAVCSSASSDIEIFSEANSKLIVESISSGDATFKLSKNALVAAGIVECSVAASYTVALTGYSDKLRSVDQVTVDLLGIPSLENQLCLAAKLALANAGVTTIKVLALDLTPADGSTEIKSLDKAYTDALAIINNDPDVYAICPLTTDIQTVKKYKAAAEAMSVPKKGKFRIVLGSSEGAPSVDFIVGSSKAPVQTGSVVNGNIADSEQNFKASYSKVLEGDTIVVTDSAGSISSGVVSSVTTSTLSITWSVAPANGDCSYYVMRDISGPMGKDRQIELLSAIANELSSNRLLMVFPGICSIFVDGVDYPNVDSYFLTSALAGIMAGVEAHRPKNNISVTGITGLTGSNLSRFNDDQIEAISDAGFFVFIQETVTSAPFCMHQVMTKYGQSKGIQELTELSVINNFDFVSRFFKRSVEPYLGTHNVTPDTLGLMRASLDSAIATLRLRVRPQIGAPIISGAVELIRQADYDKGTVESRISVVLPKVLNKIVLEIVSA